MATSADIEAIFGSRVYVRERELLTCLPLSRTTLWRWERLQQFPKAVRLGAGIKAWRVADVVRWLQDREGVSP